MPWRETSYLRFFPSLTWQCSPQVERVLATVRRGGRLVDLGAGGRNVREDCLRVDFVPYPDTDLVADVHRLPFPDGALDAAFATGLLEHVDDDRGVLGEMARVLRAGGTAHVEMPFLQQHHRDPIDVRRMSVEGLEREMTRAGLRVERSGFHIGPTVTMITLLTHYAALWFEGRSLAARIVSTGAFFTTSVLLYPLKFLDALLRRKPNAQRLAFGVYCTARKGSPAADPTPGAQDPGRLATG